MDRICDPFAYGDGPLDTCFWSETVSGEPSPALDQDIKADIAIIGAGFTGLSAAIRLAEAGRKVVVLEAKQPGWGASGRNGGFCCLGGSKLPDAALKRKFGASEALEYRLVERDAVNLVDEMITSRGIDVDRHSDGETILAHRPKDFAELEGEVSQLSQLYGVEPVLHSKPDLVHEGMAGGFHGGLTIPVGFALNPKKYVLALADAAQKAGASIFGDSAVTKVRSAPTGYVLETDAGSVQCQKLIIATNGYSSEDLPDWMGGRFIPAQSSVLVTRPLSLEERESQGWTSHQMAYDTRNLLHYFRLMPDGRFLFGMRGGLATSEPVHHRIRREIRRDFERMFPAWAHVDTPHYWSGFVCFNSNLTPFAGRVPEHPDMYAAFAYHGNGVAMGSYCGTVVADQILGRETLRHPQALQTPPKRFPGGRWRRAGMWPAYLGYKLIDL
ncbi:NAD(P)/FAD-dependent oxidoreductase [Shimia thalassica]|uniref:NAD(P)/FAD-dependent oxidoreductase n=1 Tax=Shimia thalassica TaxID=1715693 RepID=UPI0026E292C3|nr:FAD-binding oxidoreductase [Shimia thalassica]MDO6479763.1 FAD-binding oxidoreductase [Shimia thalassica]